MTTTQTARLAAAIPDRPRGAVRTLLPAEDTGGAVSVVELPATPADPPVLRRCLRSVVWTVIEGEAAVVIDGRRTELQPGEVAFAPAGVPYSRVGGPNGARLLAIVLADGADDGHAAHVTDPSSSTTWSRSPPRPRTLRSFSGAVPGCRRS